MITVLGIDPGAVSGWGLVAIGPAAPALLEHGAAGKPRHRVTGPDVRAVLRACDAVLPASAWPPVLAIEGQWIPPTGKGKRGAACDYSMASSALEVARWAGLWIGVAEAYGVELYQPGKAVGVHPATWRAAIYGATVPAGEQKAAALRTCAAVYGVALPATRHHTAEAILIATWAATEIRKQALTGRKGRM